MIRPVCSAVPTTLELDLTVTVTDSVRPRLTASRTFTVTRYAPEHLRYPDDGAELTFEW